MILTKRGRRRVSNKFSAELEEMTGMHVLQKFICCLLLLKQVASQQLHSDPARRSVKEVKRYSPELQLSPRREGKTPRHLAASENVSKVTEENSADDIATFTGKKANSDSVTFYIDKKFKAKKDGIHVDTTSNGILVCESSSYMILSIMFYSQ